ncbi:MAG: hypothetical protein GF364_17340 [Candidatus Lokiarchaeota archaeon]|nr:hypothetical protein [Candidatus Lokiarchaeota archaeon]
MSSEKHIYLTRLILDILKPHEPSIDMLAIELVKLEGANVDGVNITLVENDRRTQTVKIVIEGKSLNYPLIKRKLESLNCAIHSLDQVVCGSHSVEFISTPQD